MTEAQTYYAVQTAPPQYSPANEEALLGALLVHPESLRTIDLDPDEFLIIRHQWLYQVMQELFTTGRDVDITSVCTRLDEQGRLAEIGGPAFLTRLTGGSYSTLYVDTYAGTVRDRAKRRRALDIASRIARAAQDETAPLVDGITAGIDSLSRLTRQTNGAVHVSNYIRQMYDEIEHAAANPQDIYGIPTGILDFDSVTGGLQRGEVLKLTGDPGIGKSLLAYQMACGMAEHAPGAVYQLEMSGLAVLRRRLSAMSRISTRHIRQGKIADDGWTALVAAMDAMGRQPIYLSDSSAWTTTALRVDLERLMGLYGVQWVLIDYEGLLMDNPDDDDISRSKVISSRLHGVIKDLNLAGLVVDDMNKAGIDNAAAGKANLSGSARKIYDADQIVMLKANKTDPRLINMVWGKNREGDTDRVVQLRKTPGFPAFQDVARQTEVSTPEYYNR